jgi:hypothetical protein
LDYGSLKKIFKKDKNIHLDKKKKYQNLKVFNIKEKTIDDPNVAVNM